MKKADERGSTCTGDQRIVGNISSETKSGEGIALPSQGPQGLCRSSAEIRETT